MGVRKGNTDGLGVESKITYFVEGIKSNQDILILEDFTINSDSVRALGGRNYNQDIFLEKGVLLSFYTISFTNYTDSVDKALYINLRLLKAHNEGYDNPLVGKQFQVYLLGLSGLKYKQVKRDSHLLKISRQAKIKALLGK